VPPGPLYTVLTGVVPFLSVTDAAGTGVVPLEANTAPLIAK